MRPANGHGPLPSPETRWVPSSWSSMCPHRRHGARLSCSRVRCGRGHSPMDEPNSMNTKLSRFSSHGGHRCEVPSWRAVPVWPEPSSSLCSWSSLTKRAPGPPIEVGVPAVPPSESEHCDSGSAVEPVVGVPRPCSVQVPGLHAGQGQQSRRDPVQINEARLF